ncbi:MAG: hypothetical protein NTW86_01335 [Candidatus Sumerlaeota bacterium]|nr:hypothetical protein [Candidatus Sumerlaeota bacterium]
MAVVAAAIGVTRTEITVLFSKESATGTGIVLRAVEASALRASTKGNTMKAATAANIIESEARKRS